MTAERSALQLLQAARSGTSGKAVKEQVQEICACVQELMQDKTLSGAGERSRLKRELMHACEELQRGAHAPSPAASLTSATAPAAPAHHAAASEGHEPDASSAQWRPSRASGVNFEQVHGLKTVLDNLHDSMQLPLQFPALFERLRIKPCRAMLLYGPPGTGKSLVARALAGEHGICLFEASCAQVTSRWVGESEKLLRSLFAAVHAHAPAVLFLDEIDSIAASRESDKACTVADQRLLNQLLLEMDSMLAAPASVFMLAATNLPWQLDPAVLRRFAKRVHVGLPSDSARIEMIRDGVGHHAHFTDDEYEHLATVSKGLSGSDIANASREALMSVVHRMLDATSFDVLDEHAAGADAGRAGEAPCPPESADAAPEPPDAAPEPPDAAGSGAKAPAPSTPLKVHSTTFKHVCQTYGAHRIAIPKLSFFEVQMCLSKQTRTVPAVLALRYSKYAEEH